MNTGQGCRRPMLRNLDVYQTLQPSHITRYSTVGKHCKFVFEKGWVQ